jgi:hypothetical protein
MGQEQGSGSCLRGIGWLFLSSWLLRLEGVRIEQKGIGGWVRRSVTWKTCVYIIVPAYSSHRQKKETF